MDDLGPVKTIDRLGQSVVVAVADAADEGLDSGLGKPFAIPDLDIVGVMDETAATRRSAIITGLLERILKSLARIASAL